VIHPVPLLIVISKGAEGLFRAAGLLAHGQQPIQIGRKTAAAAKGIGESGAGVYLFGQGAEQRNGDGAGVFFAEQGQTVAGRNARVQEQSQFAAQGAEGGVG